MNTKQLWYALSQNNVTGEYFDGVFSYDTLKCITTKPKLIICNTDPSYKPGKHWVLFFFNEDSVDFYDSLGRDISYYGIEFVKFVNRFAIDINQCLDVTQPDNTSICGILCLFYAYQKCKNSYSLYNIVNLMKNVNNVVKFVIKVFKICVYYESKLLQKCVTV